MGGRKVLFLTAPDEMYVPSVTLSWSCHKSAGGAKWLRPLFFLLLLFNTTVSFSSSSSSGGINVWLPTRLFPSFVSATSLPFRDFYGYRLLCVASPRLKPPECIYSRELIATRQWFNLWQSTFSRGSCSKVNDYASGTFDFQLMQSFPPTIFLTRPVTQQLHPWQEFILN